MSKLSPFSNDEQRWAAVLRRDPRADGSFYYSVRTTRVYCRPTCAARPPRRENVHFHSTREEAERAGFRPCKRCRPNEPALAERRAAAVAKACRLMEAAEEMPTLEALAEASGMSRFHFHRVFKATAGVTPKAYAAAHRAQRVRDELGRTGTVTEAIYGAGFNSNGHFYATASDLLGMTPTTFRAGGSGASIRFAVGECSLGSILIAASSKRRPLVSICHSTSAAPRSSSGSGKRCARFRLDRPRATRRSPRASARQRRYARWPERVPRIRSPSPFPAIGSSATTGRSPATDGACSANGPCSSARPHPESPACRARRPSGRRRDASASIRRGGDSIADGDAAARARGGAVPPHGDAGRSSNVSGDHQLRPRRLGDRSHWLPLRSDRPCHFTPLASDARDMSQPRRTRSARGWIRRLRPGRVPGQPL